MATVKVILPLPPQGKQWCSNCAQMFAAAVMRTDATQGEYMKLAAARTPTGIADLAPDLVRAETGSPILEAAVTVAPSLMIKTPTPVCWTHIYAQLPSDIAAHMEQMNQPAGLITGGSMPKRRRDR
jgi:hypothetical protein